MKREDVLLIMNQILERNGKRRIRDSSATLRSVGFRSLDFAELALRVEALTHREIDFDAVALRSIGTVNDVLDFFAKDGSND